MPDNFQSLSSKYKKELMELYARREKPEPPAPPPVAEAPPEESAPIEEAAPTEKAAPIEKPLPPDSSNEPAPPKAEPQPEAEEDYAFLPLAEEKPDSLPDGEEYNDEGYLIVTVSTAMNALPISGAVVTVCTEDNKICPLKVMQTGADGKTAVISLKTKPAALSEAPGNSEPYLQYNITAEAAGYYPVENLGVPIYAGITSIQPISLIPLPENQTSGETIIYKNTKPNL